MHTMRLKENIDLAQFLMAVSTCKGEVSFTTAEGDVLNLKSALSRYVFVVAMRHPELLENGQVVCETAEDAGHMMPGETAFIATIQTSSYSNRFLS